MSRPAFALQGCCGPCPLPGHEPAGRGEPTTASGGPHTVSGVMRGVGEEGQRIVVELCAGHITFAQKEQKCRKCGDRAIVRAL
jgi:hypothetical protein